MTAEYLNLWILFIAILLLAFSFDDFFIDFILFFKNLKPQKISKVEFKDRSDNPIAIMIANWHESEVLADMVEGNFGAPDNYHVFLGVYPNDNETYKIALEVSKNKEHVHVVVNEMNGPTYKGQMLNVILKEVFNFEKKNELKFDGFVLHDSEDVLSENQIKLYHSNLKKCDFIQTPVLSLSLPYRSIVGSTYIDEFVEIHVKELLVREYLGAALPSAGVGTCLSRDLILRFILEQKGEVFLQNALTEDYNLGLQAKIWGYKSCFVCAYPEGEDPRNLIATREYFPDSIYAAVKQKTRWTLGIAFQGFYRFGWFGDAWERYFLWRDRKVILSTLININAFVILLYIVADDIQIYTPIRYLMLVNLLSFVVRMGLRSFYVASYFGADQGMLSLARWPVGIFVNTLAGVRAIYQILFSQLTGRKIKWSKTKHKIPKLIKNKAS